MSSRSRRIVRSLMGVSLAAAAVVACVPPPPNGPPPAASTCNRRVNNTEQKLLECVTVEGVRQHQAQFQHRRRQRRHPLVWHARLRRLGRLRRADLQERRLRGDRPAVRVRVLRGPVEPGPRTRRHPATYDGRAPTRSPVRRRHATGDIVPVDVVIPPDDASPARPVVARPRTSPGSPLVAIALDRSAARATSS